MKTEEKVQLSNNGKTGILKIFRNYLHYQKKIYTYLLRFKGRTMS